ncbi:MAG: hypothetical protein AB1627_05875 [Chloroflexota bacterium]
MTVTVRQWRRLAFWGSLVVLAGVFAVYALLFTIGADFVGGPLVHGAVLLLWVLALGRVAFGYRQYR